MKIAKKTLSVVLAFLMMFTTCSVCLSGFTFNASAASVNGVNIDAAAAKTGGSSNANSWTFSGDDGTVYDAVKAIYSKIGSTRVNSSSGNYNSPDTLLAKIAGDSGASSGTTAYSFIQNVVFPGTSRTNFKGYTGSSHSSSWSTNDQQDNYNRRIADNTDITSNSNVVYNTDIAAACTKTVTVNIDAASYILTALVNKGQTSITSLQNLPVSYVITYNISTGKYAKTTSESYNRNTTTSCGKTSFSSMDVTHNYTSYIWTYFTNVNAVDGTKSNTAYNDFTNYQNFMNAYINLSKTDLFNGAYNGTIDLDSVSTQATNYYNDMAKYLVSGSNSNAVIDNFLGTGARAKLDAFVKNINTVKNAITAHDLIDNLEGYKSTYNTLNPTAETYKNPTDAEYGSTMDSIYAGATTDYNQLVSLYTTDVAAFLQEAFPGTAYAEDYTAVGQATVATIKSTYYKYHIYNTRNSAVDYINTQSDYLAGLKQTVLDADKTDDATPKITDSDYTLLQGMNSVYQSTFADVLAQYKSAAPTEYAELVDNYNVGDVSFATFAGNFQSLVKDLINTRQGEDSFSGYYITGSLKTYLFDYSGLLTNDELETRYTTVESQRSVVQNSYNSYVSNTLLTDDVDLINQIFSIIYKKNGKDTKMLLHEAMLLYLDNTKADLIARNDNQLATIRKYISAPYPSTITYSNFAGVKGAIAKFDQTLYTFVQNKSWAIADTAVYAQYDSLKTACADFLASGGNFEKTTYRDANGVYTTRYAGDQTDAEGNQLGYTDDLARDGADDNYDVTETRVKQTITKLDTFITSADFADLTKLKDKEGNPVENLSAYIETLLSEQLFTNDMVNTLVGAMFPMICTEITNLISNVGSMGISGINPPTASGAAFSLDLDVLAPGTASGIMNVYLDGSNGTVTIVSLLSGLGVNVYPSTFANSLPSKYSAIKSVLSAAGTDWSKLVGADGTTKLTFDWGVSDYTTFVSAVGDVFNSILPLLQTLLVGRSYSEKVSNVAYAYGSDVTVKYSGMSFNVHIGANADVTLGITAQNLYKDLWIPLMEALGVTDDGYTFKTLSSTASAAEIADAMFLPVLEVVNQLKKSPIEKLCEILPQLSYFLSFDGIQSLLNTVNVPITAKIEVNTIKDIGWNGSVASWFDFILDWFKGTIKSLVNNNLPSIDQTLNLGSMLNLSEMLGVDLTDFNAIVSFVLEKAGVGIELPVMNVGEVITCATLNKNASSYRTSGKRTKLTADTADVFYLVLRYLVSAIGDRTFLDSIVKFIQTKNATGEDAGDGSGDTTTEALPDIVYSIVDQVKDNPDNALAALVEMFCPNTDASNKSVYDSMEYDWYQSDYEYPAEDMTPASIVYLHYGNNWTKTMANDIVDNSTTYIDDILAKNPVTLTINGAEVKITNLTDLIKLSLESIFTNDAITGVVKGLVTVGATLSKNETVSSLLKRELGVDLTTWFTTFGSYFPDIAEKAGVEVPDEVATGINGVTVASIKTGTNAITGEEETKFTWNYKSTEYKNGDREGFINIFLGLCQELAPAVSLLLSGQDLSLFNNAITIKGFEGYASSVGMVFEMLGINEENSGYAVMTQEEYNNLCYPDGFDATETAKNKANAINAFNTLTRQLFNWLDTQLKSDNFAKDILNLIPRICYFVESNGLAACIHNVLMPLLVFIDELRPILDINVNELLSVILTDVLGGNGIDTDKILAVLAGTYEADPDAPTVKKYTVDVTKLTFENLMVLADQYFDTNLAESQIVTNGIESLCANGHKYASVNPSTRDGGYAYTSDIDAADTLTILISAVLEALQNPAKSTQVDEDGNQLSNGQVICNFIDLKTEKTTATQLYGIVTDLFKGLSVDYDQIDWAYMYPGYDYSTGNLETLTLPERTTENSIVYLKYANNWSKDSAETLDANLKTIVNSFLTGDNDLTTLINNIINDKVYTEENVELIVQAIVTALSKLDDTLRSLIGTTLDVDFSTWFDCCTKTEITDEEGKGTGKYEYKVTSPNWTAVTDKASFEAAILKVLEPADRIISWLMFGDSYKFFTGSEKNEDGSYKYNDIITINGGEGYSQGLVYILEALGCTMGASTDTGIATSDAFKKADGTYDVGAAEEAVISSLLNRVDEISADPIDEVLAVLPNFVYFMNAGGFSTVIGNLLKPVNALIEKVSPIAGDSVQPIELSITWNTIYDLAEENGITIPDGCKELINNFYFGKLQYFTSANGLGSMRMVYSEDEDRADMETIVLSILLETVGYEGNAAFFSNALGAEKYNALMSLYKASDFDYDDANWTYIDSSYDMTDKTLADFASAYNAKTDKTSIAYLDYNNDWNKNTANTLMANLNQLIDYVLQTANKDDQASLGKFLSDAVTNGVYTEDVLNDMVCAVVKLLAGLDSSLIEVADATLGTRVQKWFDMCDIVYAEDGKTVESVTIKEDKKITDVTKENFAEKFAEAVSPVTSVISWLMFGENYKFFYNSNGEDMITINGGQGYDNAVVYLLEALGCENVKSSGDYLVTNDDGSYYDANAAVTDVVTELMARIDTLCDSPANGIMELLPNLVYFVGADGLSVVAANLLKPVNSLLSIAGTISGNDLSINKLTGIDLSNLNWDTIFSLISDKAGITVPTGCQEIIKQLHVGTLSSNASANGKDYIKMLATDNESRADVLTVILCAAGDIFTADENTAKFSELLGADKYNAVLGILNGTNLQYNSVNWGYMDSTYTYNNTDPENTATPVYPDVDYRNSVVYLKYANDWTSSAAETLDANLKSLVEAVLKATGNDKDLGTILTELFSGNVYNDKVFNSLVSMIVEAVGGLNQTIVNSVGATLGVDVETWLNTYGTYDAETKTYSYTDRTWNVTDKASFVDTMITVIAPLDRVVEWLFLGKDYKFLSSSDGSDLVTITGGEGYNNAIVYILEALGCTDLKSKAEFTSTEDAERTVLNSLLTRAETICADPIDEVLALLPNIIYFISADGVKVSVNNLLKPVDSLLNTLTPFVGEDSNSTAKLLKDKVGIDISDLDWDTVFGIVENYAKISIPETCKTIIKNFYIGKLDSFTSANGYPCFRMVYANATDRADMETITLSVLLEVFGYDKNAEFFSDALGAEKYNALMSLYKDAELTYDDADWTYIDSTYDMTDKTLADFAAAYNAKTDKTSIAYLAYNNDWNKNTANTLMANLNQLIDYVLQTANKDDSASLGKLISDAVTSGVYTNEVLQDMVCAIVKLVSGLDKNLLETANVALGTDIDTWINLCNIDADGNVTINETKWAELGIPAELNSTNFASAFATIIEPANRLISWLMFGDSYKFFTGSEKNEDGTYKYNDILTLKGGQGYDNALVYILEALGCTGLKASDTYKNADGSYDVTTAVTDVVASLTSRIDELCNDPANGIMEILPNLVYFIGADGLTVSAGNLLKPVDSLLAIASTFSSDEISVKSLTGIDFSDLGWDTILSFVNDKAGIAVPTGCQEIIKQLHVGTLSSNTSVNGKDYIKMLATDNDSRADVLTIVLCAAGDIFTAEENTAKFTELLGADKYNAVLGILKGTNLQYNSVNWGYMDPSYTYNNTDPTNTATPVFPDTDYGKSIVYLKYANNWTSQTAEYLNSNLKELVDSILQATGNSDLGTILSNLFNNKVYGDDLFNSLVGLIVKGVGGLNEAVVKSVGTTLGADVETWLNTYGTYDAETKTYSYTDRTWGVTDKASFIDTMITVLKPLDRVVNWLFFGQDYKFLNSSDGSDLVTITGGEGYNNALVYILEAIGCDGLKSKAEITSAEDAERNVFDSLLTRLEEVCADPINEILAVLPNVIYFINADGAKISVNNLLKPVDSLLNTLTPFVGDNSNSTAKLLKGTLGFDLSDLDWDTIFGILEDNVNVYIPAECQTFIKEFYFGELEGFTSANGYQSFRMVYSKDSDRADMGTIVLCVAAEILGYSKNETLFKNAFGDGVYQAIINILKLKESKPMQDFSWYDTDIANTDTTVSPIINTGKYFNTYDKYWTREMAQNVDQNLDKFVGNVLCLLGIKINGSQLTNIEGLVKEEVAANLYTEANAEKLVSYLNSAYTKIAEQPYGGYVLETLKNAANVDLSVYKDMTVTVTAGDRASFTSALCQILTPVLPLLNVLLNNEDLSILYNHNGQDAITIPGSEGYAYGIIPLLEALQCSNILTPDEYSTVITKAVAADSTDAEKNAAITAIVNPVFDKIDEIAKDPANVLMELLPGVIYFINSNGLDTCVNNICNSVDTVFEAIQPATGGTAITVQSLLKIDLKDLDFNKLLTLILDKVKDSTGYDLTPLAINVLAEFTTGKVVTYVSKNGETYYTMKYASQNDRADMITVLLRVGIDFITTDENLEKIKGLLKDNITDEKTYGYVCSMLDSLADYAEKDPSMGQALYAAYYVFMGVDEAVDHVDTWYHDVNNTWGLLLHMLDTSNEPILNSFSSEIKTFLNDNFADIFDEGGVASNGFIKFFQAIAAFFQKIIAFFQGLFGSH